MRVGNDVVDLADPETQPQQLHSRFDERVFCRSELAAIHASGSPHRLRWALWAAKEGAYKALKKLEPRLVFSPRQLAVELGETSDIEADRAESVVHHGGRVLDVQWRHAGDALHAIVQTERARAQSLYVDVAVTEGDASTAVRALAARALAAALGIDPGGIEITGRPPVARRHGRSLPVDLSLSHHGRFVAFAAALLE